jgi:FkbM family methyltransferase
MRDLLLSLYGRFIRVLVGTGLDRFTMLHELHGLVLRKLHGESVVVFGKALYLDRNDDLNLSILTSYEPRETDLLTRVVRERNVVVDLGAHIGYYTLLFAHRVGPAGKVYAFEPHPKNVALLKKTIAKSGYTHVVVEQKAAWSRTGTFDLFESAEKSVDHRFTTSDRGRTAIPVETVRLDDYFSPGAPVDVIKMDVQGAEGHVLLGAQRLLSERQSLAIMTEFEPDGLRESGVDAPAFLDLLHRNGFTLFDINNPGGNQTPIDAKTLLSRYAQAKARTNLLCTKGKRLVPNKRGPSIWKSGSQEGDNMFTGRS